jgi:Fe-S cluster biogenesis protein NfuA
LLPAERTKSDGRHDRLSSEGVLVKERVQAALDKIRPALQADGGDVELVEVTADGVVKVALQGACRGCPMSQLTLANGVERVLKDEIPEVVRVEAV